MRALKGCFCPRTSAKKHPGYEDPTILASETPFTVNEIEALHDLFNKLSSSIINDGLIHKEEFRLALFRNSTKQNLFADRLFDLFDVKHNGVIEFGDFVRSLSIFHPNAPEAGKVTSGENLLSVAYRLYDLRQTGYIEREELKEMVLAILSESDLTLADDVVESMVDKTFTEVDLNGDGKIDLEEWNEFVAKNPAVIKNMTLPHLNLMGCVCMKLRLNRKDPAVLAAQTCFNKDDIEALYELFRKLSSSIKDDGLISIEEFQLGLYRNSKKKSLFADRSFHLFDTKRDGGIDFEEFVRSLSVFHPQAPLSQKAAFAFQLYDTWETGFIERGEVEDLILALLAESDLTLPQNIIAAIIDKTFKDADSKGDGKIDLEEWKDFVARNPSVLKKMTIPYLKDITTSFPSFKIRADIEDDMNES